MTFPGPFLLDSNVVLFWAAEPQALRAEAASVLRSRECALFVSVATVWELEIKKAAGRLDYPEDFWPDLETKIDGLIAMEREDALAAARLPPIHDDPFDRMLIAQAKARSLAVLTRDCVFASYDVQVIRA